MSSPPEPIADYAGTKPQATPTTAEGPTAHRGRMPSGRARFRLSYARSVIASSLC